MKKNNIDKIEEHFREIKMESIFSALKENKYKGIKRNEIDHLLKSYNINQVYSYLKIRYKKNNHLIIYLISFITLLTLLSGIALYFYIIDDEFMWLKYLDTDYYKELQLLDYGILFLFSFLSLNFILLFYEILLKTKNLKYKINS